MVTAFQPRSQPVTQTITFRHIPGKCDSQVPKCTCVNHKITARPARLYAVQQDHFPARVNHKSRITQTARPDQDPYLHSNHHYANHRTVRPHSKQAPDHVERRSEHYPPALPKRPYRPSTGLTEPYRGYSRTVTMIKNNVTIRTHLARLTKPVSKTNKCMHIHIHV
jgi:hypothetical protein